MSNCNNCNGWNNWGNWTGWNGTGTVNITTDNGCDCGNGATFTLTRNNTRCGCNGTSWTTGRCGCNGTSWTSRRCGCCCE